MIPHKYVDKLFLTVIGLLAVFTTQDKINTWLRISRPLFEESVLKIRPDGTSGCNNLVENHKPAVGQ